MESLVGSIARSSQGLQKVKVDVPTPWFKMHLPNAPSAAWHEGKTPREDYMLNAISSTGMVAQADCIVSIERKREDTAGKLWIGGNHAAEAVILFVFENGIFKPREGAVSMDQLTRDEEKTVGVLQAHPESSTTAAVALAMGKSEDFSPKGQPDRTAAYRAVRSVRSE